MGRRGIAAVWFVASGLLAGCADTTLTLRAAQAQQNSAVVLAFLDTVYNKHEVDQAFQRYVAPSLREHGDWHAAGAESPRTSLVRHIGEPGAPTHIEIEHSIAQGELVAVQSRRMRPASTGLVPTAASFDLFRLARGRIVEHWSVSESLATPGP
jgi:predicted SnoaL-like aldol condensation-catalyzing enzyme